ncbi:MAG: PKD domain-containing protein [Bacteroidetes bacterium]|nr:PKD domain-containing protein [Bacteroidota bacterium]
MLKRLLYILFLVTAFKWSFAQCPQIYDYLGNLSSRPYFVSCTGASSYLVNFASNTSWGPYTINWGDGTPNTIGASYTTPAIINHTYNSATPDTFQITLTIPSLNCTLTGVAVMEKPVNASIQIPIGGVTTACAPKALQFTNSSTDVSQTTQFVWNFGDGTPTVAFSYTNAGQTISHTYNKGTVNCQTQVTLTAKNYCTPVPTIANFNPIQIYDIDNAAITPSAYVKCWPDNIFSFTNSTNRNCVPQGNTFQRQEKWNLGNYWGMGHDSIVGWKPWPPTAPLTVAYPSVGTYTVMLLDSNLCGVDTAIISVSIVNPPNAGLIAPAGPICQGSSATFTNTSSTGYAYKWNFGDGGGFITKPFGPQSHTYAAPGPYTVQVVALIAGGGAACSDTDKVVINVLPRPTANFSVSPNTGCNHIQGAVFTDNSTSAAVWAWNFGNGNTFIGQTPPPQNYNTVGNFVATLTVTALNTCINTFTAPIKVYQTPVAAFSPTSSCVGASVTFTDQSTHAAGDPIVNWSWDFGDGSAISTASAPAHTYTTQNTYTVTFIASTATCKDTVLQAITINIKPTASFTYAPLSGCTPLAVTFTNTTANGTSYTWNFGNGNSSALVNPVATFTNGTASNKNYTVTLVASTGLGCADSVKHAVTVFPGAHASFTVGSSVGCSPVPATFTNTSTSATSYNWNFGDLGTSTATTAIVTHTYVNTTLLLQTYTVQLVATSANGCSDTTYATVSAYPKPIFNFTMVPASGCSPLSINFPPVLGAVSYTWDYGDGSPTSNQANPTHVFTNTTTVSHTYTVQLIASNAFSCQDTTYGYPVISPKPNASFTLSPLSGCSPVITTFTNTSTAATTYTWNYGDGSPPDNTMSPTHTYTNGSASSQTFTTQLIVANTFACTDTAFANPVVLPKPDAALTYTPASGCTPLTASFTNNSIAATTYTWNYGDGTPPSNGFNLPHVYTNTTTANQTYTTQLIVGNGFSCYDTAYVYPLIYPKPAVAFTFTPTTGCSPLTVSGTNTSTLGSTYNWKFGDGAVSTQTNATHTYTNSGTANLTYTCTLVASTVNGCKDSLGQAVTVFFKPKSNFTVDTPACSPKALTFTNTSVGAVAYQWDFGNSITSVSSASTITQQYINNSGANINYTVQLIVTSAGNCKDTLKMPLIIHPKPDFTITAVPDSGCTPLTVNFPAIPGVSAYQWTFGDGNVASGSSVSNVYYNNSPADKMFTVQLIATDGYGCKDTAVKVIRVFAKPIALFQANPNTVFVPQNPVVCSNLSTGASSYYWDFGDGGTSTAVNPSYTYQMPGEYQIYLVAINTHGCRDTFDLPSKIIAQLESEVDVPNAFTPNPTGGNGGGYSPNDVNNDVFHPVMRGIDKYELNIFSRWGELLFVSKDVNIGWDGYYKGKLCTQDVYIWKINATTLDGKKINKTGDVLLLR